MWAARELGADRVKVLQHATSGDITGDYDAVVGYGAAAILKTK
jgi:AmmeMemoRadiSam system protein B